jgi:hypothetical protein
MSSRIRAYLFLRSLVRKTASRGIGAKPQLLLTASPTACDSAASTAQRKNQSAGARCWAPTSSRGWYLRREVDRFTHRIGAYLADPPSIWHGHGLVEWHEHPA